MMTQQSITNPTSIYLQKLWYIGDLSLQDHLYLLDVEAYVLGHKPSGFVAHLKYKYLIEYYRKEVLSIGRGVTRTGSIAESAQ